MVNRQAPIHSGFGPRTTASEVLAGQDLSGVTAIVTGGHSGLGLETTKTLAGAGAYVVVGARRLQPAKTALEGMGGLYCADCDIARLAADLEDSSEDGVRDYAIDPEQASRLWALSAELAGIDSLRRTL